MGFRLEPAASGHATPSFDATLKTFTDGIEKRDAATLSFLGIHAD
jgi:hypothetical protein